MKKIFFGIFLLFCCFSYAEENESFLYKGFPLYPASIVAEYNDIDTAHIKVPLESYDYLKDAERYVSRSALKYGWKLEKKGIEKPITYFYVNKEDPTRVVRVTYNLGLEVDGTRADTAYFDAVQGSVEFTFWVKDMQSEYKVKQIVTKTLVHAKEAYIRLLKKEKFDIVAEKFSISKILDRTVSAGALPKSIMVKEIMRLSPGQTADIYQDKDGLFYIVKLIDVVKSENLVEHKGQNTEDRRPSSAALTVTGKDSSLAEVMVDKIIVK